VNTRAGLVHAVLSDWPTDTLAKCIKKTKIPAKIPRKMFLDDGPIPIISQEADFVNGYWDQDSDIVRVTKPVVVFGDHTQVLKLVDFDFVVGADGVKILKPKDFLDAAFLKFFLEANPFPSLGYARHYRHISGLEIPLPPLEEQRRIVAKLDQAFTALDRARAHAEANLADAEALFQTQSGTVFENLFQTHKSTALSDIAKKITKGSSPKWQGISYVDEPGVLFVTSENVSANSMDFSKTKYVETAFNEKE